MSSVHDRLAECEQRNGVHLEDLTSGMMCCVFLFVLCYVSRPLIHLFLQMLKYVLPYKCKCIMISNTVNFLTLKIARFAGEACIIVLSSGSQSVLRRSQGIRDQFPGDPGLHFFNGYFEIYFVF